MKGLTAALRGALRRDRERYVVATGPFLGFTRGAVRRAAEARLRALGTDYLDVLPALLALEDVGVHRRGPGGAAAAEAGGEGPRPRRSRSTIGRAPGRLAEDSILDVLMIRYNAAHPGAETDVFPHLARRRPAVVAYTATSWRKLLRAPRGWSGRPMTAGRVLPLGARVSARGRGALRPAERGAVEGRPRRGGGGAAPRGRHHVDARVRAGRARVVHAEDRVDCPLTPTLSPAPLRSAGARGSGSRCQRRVPARPVALVEPVERGEVLRVEREAEDVRVLADPLAVGPTSG